MFLATLSWHRQTTDKQTDRHKDGQTVLKVVIQSRQYQNPTLSLNFASVIFHSYYVL